jgi:small ligand-binding sensory domain FIST
MQAFSYGHASAPDWRVAASACLDQIARNPCDANLGFLYATDLFAGQLGDILEFFRSETGVTHWVGTVGVGILASFKEYLDEPALAVMIAQFPQDAFSMLSPVTRPQQLAKLALRCGEASAHFGVVHGDPGNEAIASVIRALAQKVESGFIVGGLTSSRAESVQVAGESCQGGLSGVLFSSEVAVATRLTQGCSPIGAKHEVTECQDNIVIELDGRPALDVFKQDIGDVLARNLNRLGGHIFAGLPIAGSDTGDYLVRNLVGIDPEHKLIAIAERLEAGASLMFCRRDRQSACEDMRRMLKSIKSGLYARPKGGVYYSCLGRGASLFGPDSAELKLIEQELGQFPLVGFFCNGEISHNRLYGYSGVLTLFT